MNYALIVHEELEYQHAAPTRAKYLEAAVQETLDQIVNEARRVYKEFLNAAVDSAEPGSKSTSRGSGSTSGFADAFEGMDEAARWLMEHDDG